MTRTRAHVPALLTAVRAAAPLVAAAAVLLLPGTAVAQTARTTPADVAGVLRTDHVYVAPDAEATVDVDRLQAEIGRASEAIYVAVLPARAASAYGGRLGVTAAIGDALGSSRAVLFTVSGTTLAGGAGPRSGLGGGEADSIARANQGSDTTAALVGAVRQAAQAAQDGPPSGAQPSTGFGASGGSGSRAGGVLLGVVAVGAAGGGALLYARSRRRRTNELEGMAADVRSLYDRLGFDVSTLSPGGDAVAGQALADAAERYTATGALLEHSDTPGEFAAARRTVVEGLSAARLVRERLGLDPGPEVPPPPGTGPQLRQAGRVQVGADEYDGSPTYAPGRQHYFGGGYLGGRMVPGGWYGVPFWETMVLGSVLSGGLGGGLGYGGGGFERGYEAGQDDAQDSGGGGGFGGGDFGGGDFGGGGGFGGGDFGGGGGGDGGGGW